MSKFELKMPRMGESISEATIISWLINEGDTINEGDIIVEVATDKVDNEVPAPISGTLIKTFFHSKDVVPVGEVIAILEVSEVAKSSSKDAVSSSAVETPQKNEKGSTTSSKYRKFFSQ